MLSSVFPKQAIFVSIKGREIKLLVARKPFQNRAGAILGMLSEVLQNGPIPDRRFLINIGDRPCGRDLLAPWCVFGPAEAEGYRDIAAPDFVFGGWPEAGVSDFDSACISLRSAGLTPAETSLMGWYGNATRIEPRQRLLEIAKLHPGLLEAVDVGNWFARGERLDQRGASTFGSVLSLAKQVLRFRYLIDVEGVGYSGRLKLLLHSGRVVFMQERPWREWFFDHMRPWVHYVPVARDLSDLVCNLEKVLADPQLEQHISYSCRHFAEEHLTRKAAVGVWRALLSNADLRNHPQRPAFR